MPKIFLFGIVAVLVSACADPGDVGFRQQRVRELAQDLRALSSGVRADEANKMAVAAVEHSAELSEKYRPARLAWFNNWLVNRGLRERGLCYQWRNDLFPPLFHVGAKTLSLHLATSRRGTPFEHNAIVVTARDQAFAQGILLDPWRDGGRLWWGRLEQDPWRRWKKLDRNHTPMVLRPLLMPSHSE